jgi:hypothetical protein
MAESARAGGALMEQHILRLMIQEKLADGRLPHDHIPRVWGGPGNGETCDGCGEIVAKAQTSRRYVSCDTFFSRCRCSANAASTPAMVPTKLRMPPPISKVNAIDDETPGAKLAKTRRHPNRATMESKQAIWYIIATGD